MYEDDEYVQLSDGDVADQLGPAYARDQWFWRHIAASMVVGVVLGLVAFLYTTAIEKCNSLIWGDDLYLNVKYCKGNLLWLGIMPAGGFIVGALRKLLAMPEKIDGFVQEAKHVHVDYTLAPKVLLVSFVSLCTGVSLGPEAAMGSLGGGLAQYWSKIRELDESRTRYHVVNAMAGSMGPLFPSPVVAIVCMLELAPMDMMHTNYMRSMFMMTVGATSSFAVFYGLKEHRFMDLNPITLTYHYDNSHILIAIVIGIVAGLFGIVHLMMAGVIERIFLRISKLIPNDTVRQILLPTVGGFLVACIGFALPLSLGSGSEQLAPLLKFTMTKQMDAATLLGLAFAKSTAFGISKASGFIGGGIFPMIFSGTALGMMLFRFIDDSSVLPFFLACTCFMGAVPASVTPMPLTWLLLVSLTFEIGATASVPIFVAVVSANLTVIGFGLLLAIVKR